MPFNVEIIGTGSSGNSVVIDNSIMIDAGLPYKTLLPYLKKVAAILITHRHGDHINAAAMKKTATLRPALVKKRLWLNADTRRSLAQKTGIVPETDALTGYWKKEIKVRGGKTYTLETFPLKHDVENQGIIVTNSDNEKLIYATDTTTLDYAPKTTYDTLLIEGNWCEDIFEEYLDTNDLILIHRAMRNLRHLSVQQFEQFVRTHSHENSIIYQMHTSEELGSRSLLNSY